jgi:methylmalonyl-CoA/ethylmalonyl-CoA epimerase
MGPDVQFDHIGLVVSELAIGRSMLREQFAVTAWTRSFSDPINDVQVQFGRPAAGPCYELIAPGSARSPIRRVLRSGDNVTNHVAYRVGDLADARSRLMEADFIPISPPTAAIAYGGAAIQFFMSPIFSLVELIEAPDHQHAYQHDDRLAHTDQDRSQIRLAGRLHADRFGVCQAGRDFS